MKINWQKLAAIVTVISGLVAIWVALKKKDVLS